MRRRILTSEEARATPQEHGRKRQKVNGWVVLDKPHGMNSTRAVAIVRRAFNAEKAGHGGTLDPLATGVLPIALGEATKTVGWAMQGSKRYRLTIRWGIATATDDAEGEPVETSPHRPGETAIRAALAQFTGDILQIPATYSAIHVGGQRAYALARAGIEVRLEPRPARVDFFNLISIDDPDHATFEVGCGKGVYMRSLGRDLARALGTAGHLSALRRLDVGAFNLDHAIQVEKLLAIGHIQDLSKHLLPIETPLDDIPAVALMEAEAARLRQGQSVLPLCPRDRARIHQLGNGAIIVVSTGGKLVAIAETDAGKLRPVRVMNL